MPKRQKRVKLSKAQILENDTNKWLAKKSAAIDMLCKAMERLKECEQRSRRLLKREQVQAAARKAGEAAADKIVGKPRKPKVTLQAIDDELAAAEREFRPVQTEDDRAKRMEAMGFRKTRSRKTTKVVLEG